MTSFLKLGLCLVFALSTIQTVYSISCYICKSNTDVGCDSSPVDEKYKKDCTELKNGAKFNLCRKIEQWVDMTVHGLQPDHRVIRYCGSNQTNERECYYRAGFGGRQRVCTCKTNNCNSASHVTLTTFSLISTVFLVIMNYVL